MILKSDKIW